MTVVKEAPGQGNTPHIPPGTPRWLIPALAAIFAVAALVLFVVAATSHGAVLTKTLLLLGGLASLLLAFQMVRVGRQSGKPKG